MMTNFFLAFSILFAFWLGFSQAKVIQLKTSVVVPDNQKTSNHRLSKLFGGIKATSTSSIEDYYGFFLIEQVSIGTPAQKFNVVVDNMVSELWVMDYTTNNTVPANAQPPKNLYRMDASSSASVTNNRVFNITNSTEASFVNGPVVNETVSILGISVTSEVGRAVNFDTNFFNLPADGVLGLSWPALSATNVQSPFWKMLSQLDAAVFSFYIDPTGTTFRNFTGAMTLGAVDSTNCQSNWAYSSLTSKSFWQFQLKNVTVNGQSISKSRQAVLGLVSPFSLGPAEDVKLIANAIGAKQDSDNKLYYTTCNTTNLPNVTLDVGAMPSTSGASKLVITPQNYVSVFQKDSTDCYLGFFVKPDNMVFLPDWYIGAGMIRDYCTAYDAANVKVGFANSIAPTTSS